VYLQCNIIEQWFLVDFISHPKAFGTGWRYFCWYRMEIFLFGDNWKRRGTQTRDDAKHLKIHRKASNKKLSAQNVNGCCWETVAGAVRIKVHSKGRGHSSVAENMLSICEVIGSMSALKQTKNYPQKHGKISLA
jgi:hypothetical protein